MESDLLILTVVYLLSTLIGDAQGLVTCYYHYYDIYGAFTSALYTCPSGTRCCDNKNCCPTYTRTTLVIYRLWYFWFGLLGILVLAGALGGYFRMRTRNRARVMTTIPMRTRAQAGAIVVTQQQQMMGVYPNPQPPRVQHHQTPQPLQAPMQPPPPYPYRSPNPPPYSLPTQPAYPPAYQAAPFQTGSDAMSAATSARPMPPGYQPNTGNFERY